MDGGTWRTSLEGHKQSDVDLAAEHTCRLLNGMLGNQQKTMVDVDLTSAYGLKRPSLADLGIHVNTCSDSPQLLKMQ